LEEERRLFYVAITRARKRVNISFAQNRYRWGTPPSCQPSRFLRDIDPKYLDMPAEQPANKHYQDYDEEADWEDSHGSRNPYNHKPAVKFTPGGGAPKTSSARSGLLIPKKPSPLPRNAGTDFKPDNPDLIQAGMKVEHATFGTGKVVHIEGVSPNRKATVFFQEMGEEKQLLLKFAKLRIVTSNE
jgi:DNA helicase-2/ATP-dependent DNA helicase PcrA